MAERKTRYRKLKARKHQRRSVTRLAIQSLAWIGAALLYYIGFSLLFDTPHEYELKQALTRFEREYNSLLERYDSLDMVLDNVTERDREIFNTMFESDPYNFDADYDEQRLLEYEHIFTQSNSELEDKLEDKLRLAESRMEELGRSAETMRLGSEKMGKNTRNIPAIQPIANKQLTLLTASYGMRMHPFYRTLKSHQGVDYTVPEGTRIFATADGTVKRVSTNSTSGKEITLDHGNGYTTTYSHIGATTVGKGAKVKRGDIIALSGNTGLSITPHLHYEVSYNGMRVDPIHYFFLELTPSEYQRMIKISQSGMQSFD